jgi:hypothetical protein
MPRPISPLSWRDVDDVFAFRDGQNLGKPDSTLAANSHQAFRRQRCGKAYYLALNHPTGGPTAAHPRADVAQHGRARGSLH